METSPERQRIADMGHDQLSSSLLSRSIHCRLGAQLDGESPDPRPELPEVGGPTQAEGVGEVAVLGQIVEAAVFPNATSPVAAIKAPSTQIVEYQEGFSKLAEKTQEAPAVAQFSPSCSPSRKRACSPTAVVDPVDPPQSPVPSRKRSHSPTAVIDLVDPIHPVDPPIVTKFPGRWDRRTRIGNVVQYSRKVFTRQRQKCSRVSRTGMTLPGQDTCLPPMFHLTMDPPPPTIEDLGDLPQLADTLARKSINYHGTDGKKARKSLLKCWSKANFYEGTRSPTDPHFWSIKQEDLYASVYCMKKFASNKWIN
jgi:hypothetical protein